MALLLYTSGFGSASTKCYPGKSAKDAENGEQDQTPDEKTPYESKVSSKEVRKEADQPDKGVGSTLIQWLVLRRELHPGEKASEPGKRGEKADHHGGYRNCQCRDRNARQKQVGKQENILRFTTFHTGMPSTKVEGLW